MGEKRVKNVKNKNLYFDTNDPKSIAAVKLLDKAGRKQSALVGIMANEFMESFGITEDISEKELKKIISMYDILKNMKGKTQYTIPMQHHSEQTSEEVIDVKINKESHNTVEKKQEKKEKNNDEERKELEDALSQFMRI